MEDLERIKYSCCGVDSVGSMAGKKLMEYDLVIEQDENGVYVAHVPELPGCHTQGDSVEDVVKNASEAIELYLEHAKGKVENPMRFVGVKKVPVPSKAAPA